MRGKYKNDYTTKVLFMNSLKEIMMQQQKSYNKVGVQELCEHIGLNRKTFYYHFNNINELMNWTIEEIYKEVKEKGNLKDPLSTFSIIIDATEQNKDFFKCMEPEQLKELLSNYFKTLIEQAFIKNQESSQKKINPSYLEFLSSFYSFGIAGSLYDFIFTKKYYSSRELLLHYERLSSTNLKSIL